MKDLVEVIAEECHRQWAGWTEHLLSKTTKRLGEHPSDDIHVLDIAWVERWREQIDTPYADLSEEEKESDRREARKILLKLQNVSKELCEIIDRED